MKCATITGELAVLTDAAVIPADALANLVAVGGDVNIQGRVNLQRIDGFNALESIGGRLRVQKNPVLEGVGGFKRLTSSRAISFQQNAGYNSTMGWYWNMKDAPLGAVFAITENDFPCLQTTNGESMYFQQNNNLVSIGGFASLLNVHWLVVQKNTHLADISGFPLLVNVTDDLWIQENGGWSNEAGFETVPLIVSGSISGFNSLRMVDDTLWIEENAKLSRISGFNSLTTYKLTSLKISRNPGLESVDGFAAFGITPDVIDPTVLTIDIQNNVKLSLWNSAGTF